MKEIELFLIPAPGSKPEFLAKLKAVDVNPMCIKLLESIQESKIILEGYTRDGWAWKPNITYLSVITMESIDGRNKLPGFIKYLKQRQKSVYGRFGQKGIWIISYVQSSKSVQLDPIKRIDCRISLDVTTIPNCTIKPKQQQQQSTKPQGQPPPITAVSVPARKGGGLLGKLVGAQQRTNQHVAAANAKPVSNKAPTTTTTAANTTTTATSSDDVEITGGAVVSALTYQTAQEVFSKFRQSCQDKMLDFDMSSEEVLKFPVVLSDYTNGLPMEEKPKVTMEVLKYMVYEAAEEVNEEWVAHKEPSEFMDEITIAIYKEGAAPDDVLEEINKGELPDEVRGEQRHIQQERARAAAIAEAKHKQLLEQQAHLMNSNDIDNEAADTNVAALNTKKRDRRTIEDFERERLKRAK